MNAGDKEPALSVVVPSYKRDEDLLDCEANNRNNNILQLPHRWIRNGGG